MIKNMKMHKCRSNEGSTESISKRKIVNVWIVRCSVFFFIQFGWFINFISMYNNAFWPFFSDENCYSCIGRPRFSKPAQCNAMPIDDTDIFIFIRTFRLQIHFFLSLVAIQWRLVLFDTHKNWKNIWINRHEFPIVLDLFFDFLFFNTN